VRKARGTFVFELAEFCAIRASDYERTKQALSRQVFTHVAKYQERAVAIPRRFLYTASTNESHPLTDPTGNRRFWIATVHHENTLIQTLDIPQLWAEAKALWESSQKTAVNLALPRNLWDYHSRLNETTYLQVDAWEGIIQDYLCHRANPKADFTMKDLLSEHCLDKSAGNLSRSDQIRIGNSLTRLGWRKVRVRVGTDLAYVYRRRE
jgi:predicted P-loop ATPase